MGRVRSARPGATTGALCVALAALALLLFEAVALSTRRAGLPPRAARRGSPPAPPPGGHPFAATAQACAGLLKLRGGGEGGESEDTSEDGAAPALGAAASVAGLLQDVPERIDFPGMEEGILDYWDEVGALEQSEALARAENRKPWIFFDGPPFATGMPHYGHILAGTIKDVVTRFWSQNGRLVERKWGWDCHGLPVEYEIEQALDIKSRDDVLKMGIPAFNAECRRVVMRYAAEWKRVVRRLARWIDMDKDYKTLDATYMESVWWTCKQLHEKELLYVSWAMDTCESVHVCGVCGCRCDVHSNAQCARVCCQILLCFKYEA